MNDIKTSYKTQEVDRELTRNRQKVDRESTESWQGPAKSEKKYKGNG